MEQVKLELQHHKDLLRLYYAHQIVAGSMSQAATRRMVAHLRKAGMKDVCDVRCFPNRTEIEDTARALRDNEAVRSVTTTAATPNGGGGRWPLKDAVTFAFKYLRRIMKPTVSARHVTVCFEKSLWLRLVKEGFYGIRSVDCMRDWLCVEPNHDPWQRIGMCDSCAYACLVDVGERAAFFQAVRKISESENEQEQHILRRHASDTRIKYATGLPIWVEDVYHFEVCDCVTV